MDVASSEHICWRAKPFPDSGDNNLVADGVAKHKRRIMWTDCLPSVRDNTAFVRTTFGRASQRSDEGNMLVDNQRQPGEICSALKGLSPYPALAALYINFMLAMQQRNSHVFDLWFPASKLASKFLSVCCHNR